MLVLVLVLVLVLGAACKTSGKPVAADSPCVDGRPNPPSQTLDRETLRAPLSCPDGTAHKVSDDGLNEWCERPDGTKQGPSLRRAANGLPEARDEWRDGKRDGTTVMWFYQPAGKQQTGSEIVQYVSGMTDYEDGTPHGLLTSWSMGDKYQEGRFEHGLKDGVWCQWDHDGTLIGRYEMDHGTGTETYWHDNGKLMRTTELEDGKPDGKASVWRETGVKLREGSFADGLPHGTWTAYGPDGKQLGSYTMDHGNGIETGWSADGKQIYRRPWVDGVPGEPLADDAGAAPTVR